MRGISAASLVYMSARRSLAHLSAADVTSLHEFARFHEAHRAAISARTRAIIAGSPAWSPLPDLLSAEDTARQEEQSHRLLNEAISAGSWEPYLASMRTQGEQYARSGVGYSAWFELVRAYRESISEQLTALLKDDPYGNLSSVIAISRGMNVLINLAIEQIGEAYLDAKQRDLGRSEEMYRSLFEQSPLPMWTYDRETLRILSVNEAAVRHYGYTREEFAAMTLADIRPSEDVAALRADVASSAGFTERSTWRHRKKDGSLITVELCANDFVLDGKPVRVVLIDDVTDKRAAREALRRTESQLRHAQKMDALGRLAGGVAHDFNNILTVVQSYACMLEESLDNVDARREDATDIRRAAERGSAITRQLLTLSRHSMVTVRTVDLATLVKEFLPMLRHLVGEKISISLQCRKVPTVLADPAQLEQVLMNFAVNARDAMPAGGRFMVECHPADVDEETARIHHITPGPFVELAVTDTGVGMDAETQARIFEPFFTTKDAGQGTGLGLSIVHGIVTQAGGRIAVYSEPGHGTTFRVQLPVASSHVSVQDVPDVQAPATLPALRILVVDDQPQVRAIAVRVLKNAGCTVIEAATAEEARKICVRHEEPIDLVLLDIVLSDGRGDVLVDELRALRPRMSFLLMSGYPAGALTPTGAPMENLLQKPFSPSQLRAAVAKLCGSATHPVESIASAHPATKRHRVLVADDDDLLRHAVVRMLRKAEFDVVDVDTGSAAIRALEAEPFEVVVSDVQMPDGTGLDLLRAVRRVDLDIPVILVTGEPSVEAAAAAVEYGAFRYLTKPLDSQAFVKSAKHAARACALARIRREAYGVTGAHAGVADRAGLEVRFEQALQGMWMAFQPIVYASNGAMFGIEALMRSSEPSFPTPPALIDAAIQLDRLPLVGRKVRALSSAAIERRNDPLTLFVNLHPEDLHDVDLIDENAPLTRIASRVVLEITERASLESSPTLTERLGRLRQLGFRLAVDDIGAGYSGLTSFAELSPEIVKIDMSLARDVHKSALKQRTIAALCRLCHEVGTLVVAEGVETLEEREVLAELGCDLLQGYLFGRPQRE